MAPAWRGSWTATSIWESRSGGQQVRADWESDSVGDRAAPDRRRSAGVDEGGRQAEDGIGRGDRERRSHFADARSVTFGREKDAFFRRISRGFAARGVPRGGGTAGRSRQRQAALRAAVGASRSRQNPLAGLSDCAVAQGVCQPWPRQCPSLFGKNGCRPLFRTRVRRAGHGA